MKPFDAAYYEKHFFITLEDKPQKVFSESLTGLIEKEKADLFVQTYAPLLKARETDVAATYFASWFGAVCTAFHYSLWHDHGIPDFSLDNVELQICIQDDRPVLSLRIAHWRGAALLQSGRGQQVREAMEDFYGTRVKPVLESVASAAGIEVGQLWGALATRLYYNRDWWSKEEQDVMRLDLMKRDFEMLFYELKPEVFGRKRNPFDYPFRMMDNPRLPGEQIRIKAACCLAYKTVTEHGYCFTCPRLSEQEREKKVEQIRSRASH